MFDNIINRIMPITLSRGIDIAYRLAARTKPKKKPKNWYRHPIENLMEFIGAERVGDPGPCTREELVQLGDIPVRTTFNMGWSEWRGYASTGGAGMNGELDAVTNGQQTVDEAIEKITRDGNVVLERYYPEP